MLQPCCTGAGNTVHAMRRSPLHGVQREAGATFVEWQGALWAGDFGDATAEHLAVRADVGIWDISVLRKWELRGRRAVELVDGLFTNKVRRDEVGRIRYGLFCDEAGTILNDATVYVVSPHRVWVISGRDADGEHLAAAA